jgi:hypothetical protein
MNADRIWMGKPEAKRSLYGTRHLRERGWGGNVCIDLTQVRDQWRPFVSPVEILLFS